MEYKKVKLKEVCIVNQGLQIPISKRFKEKGPNRYFYITIQFLKGNTDEYYIENPKKSVICQKEDILVVRTGNTGMVLTGVEGCFHNNFFKVKPNEKIYSKYLYYTLNNKYMYKKMLNAASGTTIPDLKHSAFYDLVIPLPTINEQHKIVNVLESIDKKIKLNSQINDNLQKFIINLYDLKFYEKEKNGKLKDVIKKINNSVNVKTKNINLKYFPVDVLPSNYMVTREGKENAEAQSSLIEFNKYDILIGAMRVYFHRVCLAAENGITRTTTFVLHPKKREYLYYALLTMNKDLFIDYANYTSKGSTMPYAVWENVCENYEIYIPLKEELESFNKIAESIFEKMIENEKENRELEQLRDALLPKLMSGEIDLNKIEL